MRIIAVSSAVLPAGRWVVGTMTMRGARSTRVSGVNTGIARSAVSINVTNRLPISMILRRALG
jgi:hypothetical protein